MRYPYVAVVTKRPEHYEATVVTPSEHTVRGASRREALRKLKQVVEPELTDRVREAVESRGVWASVRVPGRRLMKVLTLLIVALYIAYSLREQGLLLQARAEAANKTDLAAEWEFKCLVAKLDVPYEALFYDHATELKVGELRAASYLERGVGWRDKDGSTYLSGRRTSARLDAASEPERAVLDSSRVRTNMRTIGPDCRNLAVALERDEALLRYFLGSRAAQQELNRLLVQMDKGQPKAYREASADLRRRANELLKAHGKEPISARDIPYWVLQ